MRIKEIKDIVKLGKEKFGGNVDVMLCVFKHFNYDTKQTLRHLRETRDIKTLLIKIDKMNDITRASLKRQRKQLTLTINFYEREFKKY